MTLNLRVGDWVEVRSEAEILATLDERGELENLPFMPEMVKYCGQRLTVHKVAHKLCDTITYSGIRRMENAVHLTGARCDGAAHGGCQTGCLVYWKTAWLKRVSPGDDKLGAASPHTSNGTRLLPILEINTRRDPGPDGAERFSCQTTELLRAAPHCLPIRDFRQYGADLKSGNVGFVAIIRAFLIGVFDRLQSLSTSKLPRWLRFREGRRWGSIKGVVTGRTPVVDLGLRPGERVRVKSLDEIVRTLDGNQMNRGMAFDPEMSRYCGREAVVLRRVNQVIDEKTGKMLVMKTPSVVLDDVVCAGIYKANCPRAFYSFWREAWLERVEESGREGRS